MKAIVNADHFDTALGKLKPVASSGGTLPILSCVLMEADGAALRLTTSNLDTCLQIEIPCEKGAGSLCAPVAILAEAVKRFTGDIQIGLKGKALTLRNGGFSLSPTWLDAAEFPSRPFDAAHIAMSVFPAGNLARALSRVVGFVSEDEARYTLNGVHFRGLDGTLSVEATDGRRLLKVEVESDIECDAIVPVEAVNRLIELGGANEFSLGFTENELVAVGTSWKLASKLIEGNYPNTAQVIPGRESWNRSVIFPRAETVKALGFGEIIGKRADHTVRVTVEDGRLAFASSAPDIGETTAEVETEQRLGKDPMTFGVNAQYFLDLLKAVDGDEVTIHLIDEVSPLSYSEEGVVSVLMPLRVA